MSLEKEDVLFCPCVCYTEVRKTLAVAGLDLPVGSTRVGRVLLSVEFAAHQLGPEWVEYSNDGDKTPVDRPRKAILSIGVVETRMSATVTGPTAPTADPKKSEPAA